MKITQQGFVQISKEKNGKNYLFFLPQGAQYGECYDVFHEMLSEILELAKKSVEEAKPKSADEVKVANDDKKKDE